MTMSSSTSTVIRGTSSASVALASSPASGATTTLASLTKSSLISDAVQVVLAADVIEDSGSYYVNTVGPKIEVDVTGSKIFGVQFSTSHVDATNTFGATLTHRPGVWCARTSTDGGLTWGAWQFDAPNYWASAKHGSIFVHDMDGVSTYRIQVFCAIPPDALNATYRLERHRLGTGEESGLARITGFIHSTGATFNVVNSSVPTLNVLVLGDSLTTGTIELTTLTEANRNASKLANPTVKRREISTGLALYTDTIAADIELDHRGATLDFWWLMLEQWAGSSYRVQCCVLSQSGRWQGGIMGVVDRFFLESSLGIYPGLWDDFADDGWKNRLVGSSDVTSNSDALTEGRWIPSVVMSMTHGNDIRLRAPLERTLSAAQDMFTSAVSPGTETYLTTYESHINAMRAQWPDLKVFVLNDYIAPSGVANDTLWPQLRKLFGYTAEQGNTSPPHFGARTGQSDYAWIRYVDPDGDYTSTAITTVRRGINGVGSIPSAGAPVHWAPDQHVAVQGELQTVFDGLVATVPTFQPLDLSVAGKYNPNYYGG